MTNDKHPVGLTIAGSDPSGGAGIQADLKTFSALGVYGASVITALTAQNTLGVTGVHGVPPDFIAAQFRAVVSDMNVAAIKTGMLGDAATVEIVSKLLDEARGVPVVVDPVMVATSGDVLLASDAIALVRDILIPRATLITPNVPEAAKLLGVEPAATETHVREHARALMSLGCGAVLLKGGHGEGEDAIDVLAIGSDVRVLRAPRIETQNTHGTGCTLSAAIAALLVRGMSLEDAVMNAKQFVWKALESARDLVFGDGRGPVDHQFATRRASSKD